MFCDACGRVTASWPHNTPAHRSFNTKPVDNANVRFDNNLRQCAYSISYPKFWTNSASSVNKNKRVDLRFIGDIFRSTTQLDKKKNYSSTYLGVTCNSNVNCTAEP